MLFPLIRTKWTNEHVMTVLIGVLMLYNLPVWLASPGGFFRFVLVLLSALLADTLMNFLKHRKPICAVSSAVSAAILYTLAPQASLMGLVIGVLFGVMVGKHAFGGTGKNFLNPAMGGYLVIALFFEAGFPFFIPSWLLLPALLLSLPFLIFRPFASFGLMLGMIVQLLVRQELSLANLAAYGVIFWGCIVLTDPVTVTAKPLAGGIGAFILGLALWISPSPVFFAAAVLVFNGLSRLMDQWIYSPIHKSPLKLVIPRPVKYQGPHAAFKDLSEMGGPSRPMEPLTGEWLEVVQKAGVVGQGGAGFPTWKKIETLLNSKVPVKHLIVNGVECDPGLIHDKWLLFHKHEEIEKGLLFLKEKAGLHTVTLAVKDTQGLSFSGGIKLHNIPDFYPAGSERILVREVLGLFLAHGTIPAHEGILVLNVQTVLSIYEAVFLGKRADTRYLTVSNLSSGESVVVKVALGTEIRKVMDCLYPNAITLFAGGGAMQAHQADDGERIASTVNYLAYGPFPHYKESLLCSKCGRCVSHCPEGLEVYRIAQCMDDGDASMARKYHPERCLGCGSCSYVCLAGRNLSHRVAAAKMAVAGAQNRSTSA